MTKHFLTLDVSYTGVWYIIPYTFQNCYESFTFLKDTHLTAGHVTCYHDSCLDQHLKHNPKIVLQ